MQTQPETEKSQWQETDAQGPGSKVPGVQNGDTEMASINVEDGPNQGGEFLDDQSGRVSKTTTESDSPNTEVLPNNGVDVSYVDPGSGCSLTDSCGVFDNSLPM